MNVKSLKKTYNELLERYYKAEHWFETEGIHKEDINKEYEVLRSILNNITICLKAFKKSGIEVNKEELTKGFK